MGHSRLWGQQHSKDRQEKRGLSNKQQWCLGKRARGTQHQCWAKMFGVDSAYSEKPQRFFEQKSQS